MSIWCQGKEPVLHSANVGICTFKISFSGLVLQNAQQPSATAGGHLANAHSTMNGIQRKEKQET